MNHEETNAAIPEIEITRCLKEGEDKARSFSQVYRVFEDTSTAGASKTAFRSRLRNLCQHGVVQQNDKGLFYLDGYDIEAAAVRDAEAVKQYAEHMNRRNIREAQLEENPQLRYCEKNLSEARTLIMKALVLIDKASRQL